MLKAVWTLLLLNIAPLAAQEAYVSDFRYDSGIVNILETETMSHAGSVSISTGNDATYGIAFTPDGSRAYVTLPYSSKVAVIDTAAKRVSYVIGLTTADPREIAMTPDGSRAFVTHPDAGRVTVIDTARNAVANIISLSNAPQGVAVSPDGTHVFVAHPNAIYLSVINTADDSVTQWPVPRSAGHIAITPDGSRAYMTNPSDDSVTVMGIRDDRSSAVINLPYADIPLGIAITPDGSTVYVANYGSNNLSYIDTATNQSVLPIDVGTNPQDVAITADGAQAYVTNGSSNDVTVVDTATHSVVTTIPYFGAPWRIAMKPLPNAAPTADAGADQTVHAGSVATLDGSGSSDPDANYPLTYDWNLTSAPAGSTAALSDPASATPTLTPDVEGTYTIALVVTDSLGQASAPDTVTVSTSNAAPVPAVTATPQAVTLVGTTVQLDGSQSYDPDGDEIGYQWSWVQKPANSSADFSDATAVNPSFEADIQGDYVVALTVTDSWEASATGELTVSFDNIRPTADAGTYAPVTAGESVTLDGSASSDANGDPLTYRWNLVSQPAGSSATISDLQNVQATLNTDEAGTYVVSLTVNDGLADSDPSSATVEAVVVTTSTTELLEQAIAAIQAMPQEHFKNANMRKTLVNKLSATIKMVTDLEYEEASDKLRHDLLPKTDGCLDAAFADRNDWITECHDQTVVYDLLAQAVDQLSMPAE